MTLNVASQLSSLRLPAGRVPPRITVLGLGDQGNRIVEQAVERGPSNTRCISISEERLELGTILAHKALVGKTAARNPETPNWFDLGEEATLLSLPELSPSLIDSDLVFIASSLGREGQHQTSSVLARAARTAGSLVIGAVTAPFCGEISNLHLAVHTLNEMKNACDAVVVLDANRLEGLPLAHNEETVDAAASYLLGKLIGGMVETLSTPSLISINFAEFASIIRGSGFAVLGIGEANSRNQVEEAVKNAFNCPLLRIAHSGFTGAYLHIRGDADLSRAQATRAAEFVTEELDPSPGFILGATVDHSFADRICATLMLTGVRSPQLIRPYRETSI